MCPARSARPVPARGLGGGRWRLSLSVANNRGGMIDAPHGAVWFEVVRRGSFGNGEPYSSSTCGPVLTASARERVE